jgi:BON domain-containing protein
VADDFSEFDDEYDELEDEGVPNEGLEERVLEAFRNDPILSERAIDIGGIGEETIELAGWVNSEEEAEHAVVLARGVPGVGTVVNRIAVGDLEERIRDHSRRFEEGEDALTEARWEGRTIGTGRRRQGTSDEPDRHATPRVELEERWTTADQEMQQAADETTGIAERRTAAKRAPKGDRTGGAPVSPTGVPKADHVAEQNGDD